MMFPAASAVSGGRRPFTGEHEHRACQGRIQRKSGKDRGLGASDGGSWPKKGSASPFFGPGTLVCGSAGKKLGSPGGNGGRACGYGGCPGGNGARTCRYGESPGGNGARTCKYGESPGGNGARTCKYGESPGGNGARTCRYGESPGGSVACTAGEAD